MAEFDQLWEQLLPLGRDARTGGYRRFAYTPAELACREWFGSAAADLGLDVETDRNGNLWAWWQPAAAPARARPGLAVGSHLDSVPDGGAYDGPLGVVSALAAVGQLRRRGWAPQRPLALVAFSDEEGARFGVACSGSRLLTGALDPGRARGLRDGDGVSMDEAMAAAGVDPGGLGRDAQRLASLGAFVELHVEQGRGLAQVQAPVGVGSRIWPHGRWRFTFAGQANHAGTTAMADRHDPVLAFAAAALAGHAVAAATDDLRLTFGRVEVSPNGTNAIAGQVRAWLDARAADGEVLQSAVAQVLESARGRAQADGTTVEVTSESLTPATDFDADLLDRLPGLLGDVPVLATGAGHDAGVLAEAGVPAAMLFVRNPTGVSHAPEEYADPDDCRAGVSALARVVADLAC